MLLLDPFLLYFKYNIQCLPWHSSTLTSAVKSNFFLEIFREYAYPLIQHTEWERTAECKMGHKCKELCCLVAFVFRYMYLGTFLLIVKWEDFGEGKASYSRKSI
jgi:hypothetical protein